MSADNSCSDILLPLRNLCNSVKCIRDRVKDGESSECSSEFNMSTFWNTLIQSVKATSQEATKLSLAFSKPPLPSSQDAEKMADSIQQAVLALSTVYYWLPKTQGIILRRVVRDATADVLEGMVQLLDIILNSPLQSLSQEQLMSTGGVWASCDRFEQLPRDNRAAVLSVLSSYQGVVKDAIEEMEQAQAENQDPFADLLDDEDLDERGNRDTYWSEGDRQLMAPCQGLMKASSACLKKLSSAVRGNGKVDTPDNVAQLDDLADITHDISPSVDDLALSLYPPMDHTAVELNASKLAAVLKKVLEIIRATHVCTESDLTWVQFLDGAVDHNLQKARRAAEGSD
ncbi:cyclin-D1-binding protein 1 homolog isoform X1 [Alosa sapidissima]|uniref:cyclin-D1-binding protein 1 homolog isoform X1 n=1 Tax=Alosa sapidissima TaxID=34773 RepID=UPI001C08D512|nr:cyclin-D1-binding protein 1 homolog isoform X1 [Alosa sapidissima]XP_041938017.1 cyclin-D1-binding protein 1 homolog isoform X1 [Alosa sapidissima]